MRWPRRRRRERSRFILRVEVPEAAGPDFGSGSRRKAMRPRGDSGIRLTVPKTTKKEEGQ